MTDRLFPSHYREDFRDLVSLAPSLSGVPSFPLMQERALSDRDSSRPDGWKPKKKRFKVLRPKLRKKIRKIIIFSRHQPWLVKGIKAKSE